MDNGQWTMDNGKWTMDNGQWKMENGQWTMDNGQWKMENVGPFGSISLDLFTQFIHSKIIFPIFAASF